MKLQTEIAMNGGINNNGDNNNKVMVFLVRLSGYVDDMESNNNIEGLKMLRREVGIFLNNVSGSGMDYELLINEIKVVLARINDIIEKKSDNNGELDEYLNILAEDIELIIRDERITIKGENKNMDKKFNKISVNELKMIIRECIEEISDDNDYEPIDSIDDFRGDAMDSLNDTVDNLIKVIESESGDWDKAYKRLRDIYDRLGEVLNNPRLTNQERNKLEHEYEGIMGKIWGVIGGGGSGEKFYVNEQKKK